VSAVSLSGDQAVHFWFGVCGFFERRSGRSRFFGSVVLKDLLIVMVLLIYSIRNALSANESRDAQAHVRTTETPRYPQQFKLTV
jgi:hypothetical protein